MLFQITNYVRLSYKGSLELHILWLITVSQKVYSASFLFADVFYVTFVKNFSIVCIGQPPHVNSFTNGVGHYTSSYTLINISLNNTS